MHSVPASPGFDSGSAPPTSSSNETAVLTVAIPGGWPPPAFRRRATRHSSSAPWPEDVPGRTNAARRADGPRRRPPANTAIDALPPAKEIEPSIHSCNSLLLDLLKPPLRYGLKMVLCQMGVQAIPPARDGPKH